jgi:hypothetical protein
MTSSSQVSFEFPALKTNQTSRKIEVQFSGGEVTSDAGVLLLREVDHKLGLTKEFSKFIADPRNPALVEHTTLEMLRQRVYGLCLGYEDLNDQQTLRGDTTIQTAVGKDARLASPPTLCRFENRGDKLASIEFHRILMDKFISSFKTEPEELVLDFDATDDLVHGNQEGRFFHGYYENYCFLPLYVFCGEQLLVSYLRPSNIDGAKHAWAIASLLTKALRKKWPGVKIVFRGDSGFCRHKMLTWFEKNNVSYIVGIPSNAAIKRQTQELILKAEEEFKKTNLKQKIYSEIKYAAKTWSTNRRVIVKAEHGDLGENTRYVVTNMTLAPQELYETIYCARGDMENRIKEQQLGLFADRTSCHNWWPNQFRVLLSSAAYVIMETLRRESLAATELAKAQVETIRLKLLKIGAVVIRNTRRIKILISSHYPYQKLFTDIATTLASTA